MDEPAAIAQIQGTTHLSAYAGRLVKDVTGVVTAASSSGFWFRTRLAGSTRTTSDHDPQVVRLDVR